MNLWDITITAIKFSIIAALWYATDSVFAAIFMYFLLVPLPLLVMRVFSGLGGASLPAIMLAVVGLDLLFNEKIA